ncbi:hypothetical protein IZY60_00670 [Lutibacter sp. B2]|nr:hypothetical protein [Lutibacter sp. B2]
MKKFNVKSFICGLLIGIISITIVFTAGGIKSDKVASTQNIMSNNTTKNELDENALQIMNKDDFTNNVSTQLKNQSDYDTLASETIEKTGDMNSIMVYIPHMSIDKVDAIVKDYIDKTNDFNYMYAIRQYMSIKGIDDTVKSYVDRTNDYGTVAAMLQFMSTDTSNYVAKKYINEAKDQQYRQFFMPYLKE